MLWYIGKGDDKMVYHQPSVNSRHSFPEKKRDVRRGESKNIDIHFPYNTHRKGKLGEVIYFAFSNGILTQILIESQRCICQGRLSNGRNSVVA